MIYRPVIYNLQIRTVIFSDQRKLLQKVDLRYLKTLKTKKLNTKNPKIKHCPCSKYVMIYRPDLHNLPTRKKTAKKVTRYSNWPFLIFQQIKISNINNGHKSKMVWNKKHNLQTKTVQFITQENIWIDTNGYKSNFP